MIEIKFGSEKSPPVSYLVVNACLHFILRTVYESYDFSQYLLPVFLHYKLLHSISKVANVEILCS